jgi:hypothetical protein
VLLACPTGAEVDCHGSTGGEERCTSHQPSPSCLCAARTYGTMLFAQLPCSEPFPEMCVQLPCSWVSLTLSRCGLCTEFHDLAV